MKKRLSILTTLAVLAVSAGAQEPAQTVQTSGTAELKRASELMVTQGGQGISVRLPGTVKAGEVIYIEYGGAGNTVADSFMVTGITVKDGSCIIESRRSTTTGAAPSDVIYARPCKKVK